MADQEMRKIEEMSFKEASIELERIVRSLEEGDLELEESLERYARGVELLSSLRARLTAAEQRVEILLEATSEDLSTADTFSSPSEAFVNE